MWERFEHGKCTLTSKIYKLLYINMFILVSGCWGIIIKAIYPK